MHDPMTVAFDLAIPLPRRGRRHRSLDLVTIWHRDPSGGDDTTCRGTRWQWHVHHWRLQVHSLQRLRRRLLTRCAWCDGRHTKADRVNCSLSWDGPKAPWWRGERGLYHLECSNAVLADRRSRRQDRSTR